MSILLLLLLLLLLIQLLLLLLLLPALQHRVTLSCVKWRLSLSCAQHGPPCALVVGVPRPARCAVSGTSRKTATTTSGTLRCFVERCCAVLVALLWLRSPGYLKKT